MAIKNVFGSYSVVLSSRKKHPSRVINSKMAAI